MNEQMTKKTTPGLVQTWVAVTDTRGRTRLEARWVAPQSNAPSHVIQAA